MSIKLRPEVKAFAEAMEGRMRQAAAEIAAGKWLHKNFLGTMTLIESAERNLAQAKEAIQVPGCPEIDQHLADVGAFCAMVLERLTEDVHLETESPEAQTP